MTPQQLEALKAMFVSAQPPDVEPIPAENPQELWPPPVQPQTPLPSVAAGQMLKQRPPNPQMEAPVITEAKSAIERLQNPEKKHWLVQMVQNAAEGLGAWDQSPAQFQQNQQRKQLIAEQQKQTELQRQERRIADEYGRQDREAQAARQREQDERTRTMFPVELDTAQSRATAAKRTAIAPQLRNLGPGESVIDEANPQAGPIYTAPSKPATQRAYQAKEIEGPGGGPILANFDPDNGKYYNPDTGQEIPGAKPYKAPPNQDVLDLRNQSRIDAIRGQYQANPVVKKYQVVSEATQFAKSLDPNTTSPADDQALIYAFAKAMDPDSVVREGEYAVVQKYAQSMADKFGFDVKRIFSNTQFLTPQSRANMKATITQRFAPVEQQYRMARQDAVKNLSRVTNDAESLIPDYSKAFDQAPSGTIRVQIPGQPPGEIDADQWDAFLAKYPKAVKLPQGPQ